MIAQHRLLTEAAELVDAGVIRTTFGQHFGRINAENLKRAPRTTRLPGRGLSSMDVATLTDLLREAEKRHSEYEPTAPKHHWSGWYAAYLVARKRGRAPEEAAKDAALHMEGARR